MEIKSSSTEAKKMPSPQIQLKILPDPNLSKAKQPFDPELEQRKINNLIKSALNLLHRDGAIIALSGGLDSAVTAALTVKALGKDRVLAINLPERDSKPIHQQHAKRMAKHLDIAFKRIRITNAVKTIGAYKLLPLRIIPSRKLRNKAVDYGKKHFLNHHGEHLLENRLDPPKNSWIARGNAYAIAKHRIRMVKIYQLAELQNLMVVGAANRTEWLTGTFSKWGVDHCADVMPIVHLYRSEVEILAKFLNIPDWILMKSADPDIIPGDINKEQLLGGFKQTDEILRTVENYFNKIQSTSWLKYRTDLKEELYKTFQKDDVDNILALFENSAHMRESPFHL